MGWRRNVRRSSGFRLLAVLTTCAMTACAWTIASAASAEGPQAVYLTGLAAAEGVMKSYKFNVPMGTTQLQIETTGSQGNADLYAKMGTQTVTLADYDCRPYTAGSNEKCWFGPPAPSGQWSVAINAASAYSGLTLKISPVTDFVEATPAKPDAQILQNGVPVTGISGEVASQRLFRFDVQQGASVHNLTVAIKGSVGDADLHVRRWVPPTLTSYDCRPWLEGSNEMCSLKNAYGSIYVMVVGGSAYRDLTLWVSWR